MDASGAALKEPGCQKAYARHLLLTESAEAVKRQIVAMGANPEKEDIDRLAGLVEAGERHSFPFLSGSFSRFFREDPLGYDVY